MCVCPELLETSNFAADAKAKARKILDYTRGFSMGKVLILSWYIDGQLCVEWYLKKESSTIKYVYKKSLEIKNRRSKH